MAVFKCEGYLFYMLGEFCIFSMQSVTTWKKGSKPKKQRSRILQAYKINILHTWRWPCRMKQVVKDSENQYNKAAWRWKHNLQYSLNNTVQQDAKI
jgi:hypothetical protein